VDWHPNTESYAQPRGRSTQRATENLREFNLNRTWETGLQRRAVPTPRTQRKSVPSAHRHGLRQANENVCPSGLYSTARFEAQFPEKNKHKTKQNKTLIFPYHWDVLWI